MGLEVERKYSVDDLDAVRQSLRDRGASWKDRCFEHNVVFDTADRSLKSRGMLLRLRQTGRRGVLCLKRPPAQEAASQEAKVFEEVESDVEHPEQLQELFRGLGYCDAFRYEKLREQWVLDECLICLDLLPFGRYVEIEGSPEAISRCALQLGLEAERWTTKTYHQLNQERLAEKGLTPDESFVFQEPERSRLIERNDFFC
jgi:adenylate cyclase class 2